MCCEYSRTIVYHNWLHYASSLVKCIITTLLTKINHSITYVLSRCRVATCAVVYVVYVFLTACRYEYTHNYIHCIIDLTQRG